MVMASGSGISVPVLAPYRTKTARLDLDQAWLERRTQERGGVRE